MSTDTINLWCITLKCTDVSKLWRRICIDWWNNRAEEIWKLSNYYVWARHKTAGHSIKFGIHLSVTYFNAVQSQHSMRSSEQRLASLKSFCVIARAFSCGYYWARGYVLNCAGFRFGSTSWREKRLAEVSVKSTSLAVANPAEREPLNRLISSSSGWFS